MRYNGVYTIMFVSSVLNQGRKILIVIKEQEGGSKSFFCYIRKRLTRCFIERCWNCKNSEVISKVTNLMPFIKQLEETGRLIEWYKI